MGAKIDSEHRCRSNGSVCVLSIFFCVQTLDIEERIFCSLCRGVDINTNSFKKIGESLAAMVHGQKRSCSPGRAKRGLDKRYILLRKVRNVLYLLKSMMRSSQRIKKKQVCSHWREIFEYLANKGSEIAKGFFLEEERIILRREKVLVPAEEKRRPQKEYPGIHGYLPEPEKKPLYHFQDLLLKCRETVKQASDLSEFERFRREDSHRAFEIALSEYYRLLSQNISEKTISSTKKTLYREYSYMPYFYNFKIDK